MSGVYLIVTVPPWNSLHTPLAFALTTLCLGGTSCLVFGVTGSIGIDVATLALCAAVLLAVLMLEGVTSLANQRRLKGLDTGIRSPDFGRGALRILYGARMLLLLAAGLGITILLLQSGPASAAEHAVLVFLLLPVVVLQELAGRLSFYASYFRIGL